MKVYLAGPMTGLPEFNYPAFHSAAEDWRKEGWEVLNPAENFGGDTTKEYREYIRADLAMLCQAEAIAFLPGWRKSKGATFECGMAQMLGLLMYDAETFGLLVEESAVEEAHRLVHGNRGADYGHPIEDYTRTGRMWGAILGLPDLDPRTCCLMMAALKVSREVNKHKRDNLVDLAGYAECAQMVAERQGIK